MSLGAVLFVVFLVLKLCGVIAWSWLWVTSPLWIGLVVWLVLAFLIALFGVVGGKALDRNVDRDIERMRMRDARRF